MNKIASNNSTKKAKEPIMNKVNKIKSSNPPVLANIIPFIINKGNNSVTIHINPTTSYFWRSNGALNFYDLKRPNAKTVIIYALIE